MLVAIAVILLPLLSVLLCIGAARKLSRLWRRRRAVRGEWDALAVSLIIPDVGPAEQPQTLADNPLSLRWRATSHTRGAAVLYVGEALIAVFGDAILIGGAALIVYAAFSDQYRARLATIPPYVLALVIVGPFVMTPLLILFARMLPTQFGRPFGVNADEEGISARTQFGARARLRWDDVRLVEISVAKDSPMVSAAGYAYTIYGPHSEIEWRDSYARESLPEYEPVGMTTGDAQSQARRLLAVAMARTGLPLHAQPEAAITRRASDATTCALT
jgi:hypothetical protein